MGFKSGARFRRYRTVHETESSSLPRNRHPLGIGTAPADLKRLG